MGTTASLLLNTLRTIYPQSLPDSFAILDLGSQQLSGSPNEFAALVQYLGGAIDVRLHVDGVLCRDIFRAAGVAYQSVDLNADATLRLDLNYSSVPRSNRGAFDLVTNWGTTEHLLNQMNCFEFIHDATKVGGVMVHMVPMSGYMWHCLVKYDPKFFVLLAEANSYDVLYAGFGPTEPGMPVAEQCGTWAWSQAVIGGRPLDSRLLEVVLRKTCARPFEPGIDISANSYAGRVTFGAPLASIRDRPCFVPPVRVSTGLSDDPGRSRMARAARFARTLGRAAIGNGEARRDVRRAWARLGRTAR